MDLQFGKSVYEQANKLREQGKDANQTAKVLCDQDPQGHNYGIGIVLDGNGQPAITSATLLEYAFAELQQHSQRGTYMNSNTRLAQLKQAVLQWQRIPEKFGDQFLLAIPSDAGTGAVKTGLEIALMLDDGVQAVGIEELGWPAYKAMAKTERIGCQEFPLNSVISGEGILPLYQSGPMNTVGFVASKEAVEARAKSAAANNSFVILDRAYAGFEYARLLGTRSYDEVMRMSYEAHIQPFIDQGVPFALAIGPTKAFVSFALRPCGLLLLFCPDVSRKPEMTSLLNTAMRARGSAFEHPMTRAFGKAMIQDRARLEAEHQAALERLAKAEALWRKLVQGTPMEYLYADNYAGLFRNPKAREGAEIAIYNEHIYPVFASQRCRQNVTGIPDDEELARKHVKVFAEQCY